MVKSTYRGVKTARALRALRRAAVMSEQQVQFLLKDPKRNPYLVKFLLSCKNRQK